MSVFCHERDLRLQGVKVFQALHNNKLFPVALNLNHFGIWKHQILKKHYLARQL